MPRLANPIPRLRKPKIEIDIINAYCIWMFAKADFYWKNIGWELPHLAPKAIRTLVDHNRWSPDRDWVKRGDFEARAYKAAGLIKDGRGADLLPIKAEDLMDMGQMALDEDDLKTITGADGKNTAIETVMGVTMPDPLNTIQEATKGGAGPNRLIEEIAQLLSAESLAVPNKVGFDLCPIPHDARRIKIGDDLGDDALGNFIDPEKYNGGVIIMGRPWDKSYIVPDRESRGKGVRLAKEVFGITDRDQLDLIVKKHKAVRDEIDGEFKDRERRRKYAELEAVAAIQKKPEVEVHGTKIEFHRPKQLTATQWVKEREKKDGTV